MQSPDVVGYPHFTPAATPLPPDLARDARHTPGEVLSGSQMIWETLMREGVEVVFGYPGGMIMPAYDALPEYPIHHVLVRHEQGAAHMADGYARASGKVGVAIATSGPGATNLITGMANAMMDSIPMVCITGQVPSHLLGTDAFQEMDIAGIAIPVTKHSVVVEHARDIVPALRQAFAIARSGRPGPVLVDITKDAQLQRAPFSLHEPDCGIRRASPPSMASIVAALELITASSRPLILAGHGVVQSHAEDALLRFAERRGIPVACTLLGLASMPGSHPLHLGMMGMHGEAWVNHAIQRADLLIALGMRFDDRATSKLGSFARSAHKIHVDIDPAELNKNVPVDIAMTADVGEVLESLALLCRPSRRPVWMAEIEQDRQEAKARDAQQTPDDGRLLAAHVIHDLWRATEGNATLVTDVGQHQMWAAQYYRPLGPRRFITSGGLGTMGFALPAAIGARFARPDEEIWVLAGDGGFQMTASELSTVVQEGIKLNIAVVNNQCLGMVRQQQELFHGGRYVASRIGGPDFVALAAAHGIEALRVDHRSQVASALARARDAKGTVLIDFRVDPMDLVYPMVPAGAALDQMIRRPAPTTVQAENAAEPIGWTPSAEGPSTSAIPRTCPSAAQGVARGSNAASESLALAPAAPHSSTL